MHNATAKNATTEKSFQKKHSSKSYAIFQDWKINKGNIKGRVILILFRLASLIRNNKILVILFFWYLLFYRIVVEWFLNIEIHWNATIGKNLRLEHGHGTVVNGAAVLGSNCTLRHLTTIGIIKKPDGTFSSLPVLGNNVDIGASVSILGSIKIGDNVLIGAGSVVIRNVPSNCVIAGNPARVIRNL